ncbi:MAG: RnfABCDGE type electron transport complex subunit G [Ruminococcaceae bacterium]|nr:RnfABCDGE type electron transport complex subunit G [Oscillospiraceae bacterium]
MRKIWDLTVNFIKKNKEIIVPSATLLVICLVATLLLGVTNLLTAGQIAKLEEETQIAAMNEVLPAEGYTKTEGKEIYTAEKNGAVAGYIFVTSAKGYGGDINVMTAVDPAGKILAVSILSASDETPGLGQNVTKEGFYSQFLGLSGDITVVKNGADATKNEINAVTGATISSKAVTKAVNEALTLYSENFGDAEVEATSEQEGTENA